MTAHIAYNLKGPPDGVYLLTLESKQEWQHGPIDCVGIQMVFLCSWSFLSVLTRKSTNSRIRATDKRLCLCILHLTADVKSCWHPLFLPVSSPQIDCHHRFDVRMQSAKQICPQAGYGAKFGHQGYDSRNLSFYQPLLANWAAPSDVISQNINNLHPFYYTLTSFGGREAWKWLDIDYSWQRGELSGWRWLEWYWKVSANSSFWIWDIDWKYIWSLTSNWTLDLNLTSMNQILHACNNLQWLTCSTLSQHQIGIFETRPLPWQISAQSSPAKTDLLVSHLDVLRLFLAASCQVLLESEHLIGTEFDISNTSLGVFTM